MRIADLPEWLAALGVQPDSYDLGGDGADEAYIIRPTFSGWEVFYSERGQRTGYAAFADESDACARFCALITSDLTTRPNRR